MERYSAVVHFQLARLEKIQIDEEVAIEITAADSIGDTSLFLMSPSIIFHT